MEPSCLWVPGSINVAYALTSSSWSQKTGRGDSAPGAAEPEAKKGGELQHPAAAAGAWVLAGRAAT